MEILPIVDIIENIDEDIVESLVADSSASVIFVWAFSKTSDA